MAKPEEIFVVSAERIRTRNVVCVCTGAGDLWFERCGIHSSRNVKFSTMFTCRSPMRLNFSDGTHRLMSAGTREKIEKRARVCRMSNCKMTTCIL